MDSCTVSQIVLTALIIPAISAQRPAVPSEAMITIGAGTVSVKYAAPSVEGRKIFGGTNALLPDNTMWRAGGNRPTELHTNVPLKLGALNVPPGNYSLFIWLDPAGWQLIVSKQTGQAAVQYRKDQELGRTTMTLNHLSTPAERLQYTLRRTGDIQGTLTLAWADVEASVPFTVQ